MTSLTPLKSDYIRVLEQCIADCQKFVKNHKYTRGMEKCIDVCQLCIGACVECLAACEAGRPDRGKMMHICMDACQKCLDECEKHNNEDCQRCAHSCKNCIEEFKYIIA